MIWFLGDPHGRFDYIIQLVKLHRPTAIVFLGDLECPLPLRLILRPILDLTQIWFIHGNHDTDTSAYWTNLHEGDLAHRSLHARVVEIDGVRIAGLGGTFESPVWLPGEKDTGIQNYHDFEKRLAYTRQDEEVLESKRRIALSSIFPDDYFSLAMESADVLVCHEAPSCHPYGYSEIDDLAKTMGVKKVFHGHHHDSLDYREQWQSLGFEAFGVCFRGIMSLEGDSIYSGNGRPH
jgi:predicted phosphodiesterase